MLEVGDFLTKDEAGVVDGPMDRCVNLRPDAGVLCFEVDKRYLDSSISVTGDPSGRVGR